MFLIYAAARFFPWWAVPLAIVLADIGLYFRRKKHPTQWYFWVAAGGLCLLSLIWIILGGSSHSDEWIRSFGG